jgi:hypothetical protein
VLDRAQIIRPDLLVGFGILLEVAIGPRADVLPLNLHVIAPIQPALLVEQAYRMADLVDHRVLIAMRVGFSYPILGVSIE